VNVVSALGLLVYFLPAPHGTSPAPHFGDHCVTELAVVRLTLKNIKQSHNTPMEAHGGEEVYLLLIHDVGTRCGEWSASRPDHALPPGKGPPAPIGQEAGWTSELVWTQRLEEKLSLPPPGIEPRSPRRPVRSQTL
jgi:hypothetical protein